MEFNGLVSKRVSRNADPFMFLEVGKNYTKTRNLVFVIHFLSKKSLYILHELLCRYSSRKHSLMFLFVL